MLAASVAVVVPELSTAAQAFGWTAGAVGISIGWPQVWRLWVGRKHAGLSLTSNVLAVIYSTAWLLYGVASQRTVQIVTCLIGMSVATSVLVGHLRLSKPRLRAWVPLWLIGTAVVIALFTAGRGPLGLAASAATISGVLPQLVSLIRDRRKGLYDVGGIAVSRWVLATVCNVLWVGYGLLVGDPLIVANSGIVFLLAVGIVVTATRSARDERAWIDARDLEPLAPSPALH